ncbi:MAG: peptidoglycan-associated lipoprotein [Gammaproteobacteria bacterium]|nr:peptidoglycan-associated lipoprotein [Gammaproteobacteria bacterium]
MKNILISLFSILFVFACSSVETVDVQETKTVDLTSSESDSESSMDSGSSMSELDIGEPHTKVFFDYDQDTLREDALSDLLAISRLMKENVRYTLLIEGHADERGTREYNLALSERRATAVENFLVASGVSSFNIEVVGYGEEKPVDVASNETAWAKNRRAELYFIK